MFIWHFLISVNIFSDFHYWKLKKNSNIANIITDDNIYTLDNLFFISPRKSGVIPTLSRNCDPIMLGKPDTWFCGYS